MKRVNFTYKFLILVLSFGCSNHESESSSDASASGTPIDKIVYGTGIDHEGHSFKTIKIGNQEWMAENLNVRTFRNGDSISQLQLNKNDEWQWAYHKDKRPVFCDGLHCILYNYYSITDARGIAPEGWHIPNAEDWNQLTSYLSKVTFCCNDYIPGDKRVKTASGFNAYSTGYIDESGIYGDALSVYWAQPTGNSNASYRVVDFNGKQSIATDFKAICGFACRCIKNQQ